MSGPTLELAGASIVCLGSFNPQILQPAWLAAHGLLREQESEDANIRIVHPEVVSFDVEWLSMEVTRERLSATSSQEPYDLLRDLVLGVLSLLPHTPVRAVGFNLERHYKMQSEEAWHSLGHRLAPPGNWEKVLTKPGMRSLTVEGIRTDDRPGYVRILVEPSVRIQQGAFFQVNDHFQSPAGEGELADADWAVGLLNDTWTQSVSTSDRAITSVLEQK